MDAPLLHVVLFQPEIPQNTGNIGRMCAFANARLHLIHPLGFSTDAAAIRRSGLDYWASLDVHQHQNWDDFIRSPEAPRRLWLLTTHGQTSLWEARFEPGDGLVFGRESAGCPPWLHDAIDPTRRLQIPRFCDGLRSLNLATAAGIASYEALRQFHHARPTLRAEA